MLNKLYGLIKSKNEIQAPFVIITMISGAMLLLSLLGATFSPQGHVPTIIHIVYVVGFIISFILSSQIDYKINLNNHETEIEMRSWTASFSFIWPGCIVAGIIMFCLWSFYNSLRGILYLHTGLIKLNTKIKMPKIKNIFIKETKSKPIPKQGAYRDSADTCGTCGGIK